MGAQRGDGVPKKQPARSVVGKPTIKTDVVRQLQEDRARRDAQDLDRGFKKTIAHLDEIGKLGSEAYRKQGAVLDAARTGSDPKINELAKKKAAVSAVPKKGPKMDCSGGICRIVPRKKK